MGVEIRYTYITDLPTLRKWVTETAVQRWLPIEGDIEREGFLQSWMGFSRYSASLTATCEGKPCGMGTLYLLPYQKVAHRALFQLVVDPGHVRQGIGTTLLRNLKHLARNYFHLEWMQIDLISGNPAQYLLEKQGFRLFTRQEGYFKDGYGLHARLSYEAHLNGGL